MLRRTCWRRTELWDAIWVWKSTFWSRTWIFSQKISAKSVTNTVKDFTKTLWLWKSGTKASGPQVCWQTVAAHWRGMYLKPNSDESHTPEHFRGKFLPVSWARKVLFCTFKFLCIFETLPDRKILYTYMNSAQNVLLSSSIDVRGTKKKVKFCWPVQSITRTYPENRTFPSNWPDSQLYLFLGPYKIPVSSNYHMQSL